MITNSLEQYQEFVEYCKEQANASQRKVNVSKIIVSMSLNGLIILNAMNKGIFKNKRDVILLFIILVIDDILSSSYDFKARFVDWIYRIYDVKEEDMDDFIELIKQTYTSFNQQVLFNYNISKN